MFDYLELAARISLPTDDNDPRNFWLGCVGVRRDGVIVSAKNGAVLASANYNYQLIPNSHAEGRTLRKLGKRGTLYVARVSKKTRSYAMARPCGVCQIRIRASNVDKVVYTINENQYGIWYPNSDTDKVFEF